MSAARLVVKGGGWARDIMRHAELGRSEEACKSRSATPEALIKRRRPLPETVRATDTRVWHVGGPSVGSRCESEQAVSFNSTALLWIGGEVRSMGGSEWPGGNGKSGARNAGQPSQSFDARLFGPSYALACTPRSTHQAGFRTGNGSRRDSGVHCPGTP
jgi:hypothetical protein